MHQREQSFTRENISSYNLTPNLVQ